MIETIKKIAHYEIKFGSPHFAGLTELAQLMNRSADPALELHKAYAQLLETTKSDHYRYRMIIKRAATKYFCAYDRQIPAYVVTGLVNATFSRLMTIEDTIREVDRMYNHIIAARDRN